MLPKKNKLTTKLFKLFDKKGKIISSESLTLRFLKSQQEKNYRVAVVVSLKVSKLSNKRNLLKRRVFYSIKKYEKDLINGGIYVFYLKKNIVGKKFSEINTEIQSLLKKV